MSTVKCVGILTSGGDAPGMNAAIRAVTRSAIYNGMRVKGIYRGYKGLILDEIEEFKTQNVSNIIQRGGTILKTARCVEFKTPEGRKQAYDKLQEHGIDALIAIGGDGTLTGARIFAQEFNFPIVGLPGTIDNDLYGTDTTIGYDTALNTIMECVDKIRDTATSHDRLFFVEVMGRDAGFLALNGAIASGAEAAIIPEISLEKDQLAEMIENGFRKSKNSSIVLVAESEVTGGAMGVAERVKKEYPQFDVRVSILGHLQRGGSPTAQDRILATRMGVAAIDALLDAHADAPMILDARRDDAGHRGPAPVFLGIAGDLTQCGAYALIGKTGITNVIGSLITGGHLGVSPGAATLLTGFGLVMDPSLEFSTSPSVMSPFRVYAADYAVPTPTNLTSAVASMQTAYTDAAGRSLPDFLNLLSGNIGGLTLAPGLYTWGSTVTIPSDITISGGSNDVWIFQVTGDLDLSAATHMLLAGGADARNIFWQVSGNVIVHANAHFEGNILCQTGITMQTSASLHGRALSQSLVALDNNAITAP